ncbi:MAG: hypothetical protein Q9220_001502 [cf. Caloplaca sp. 1 TL-2023]
MALTIPPGTPQNARLFSASGSCPTPWCDPKTSYLTTVPILAAATTTASQPPPGFHLLRGTPSKTPIPAGIFVPDTPPPPSPLTRNNTPTPIDTTLLGSWAELRRHPEMVERPMVPQPNEPHMTANASSGLTLFDKFISPEQPEMTCSADPENQDSAANASNDSRSGHQHHVDDASGIQPPPLARVRTGHDQVDGAPEDSEAEHKPRSNFSYACLCKSLKKLPSKVDAFFRRDNKNHARSEEALKTPSPLTLDAKPDPPSTWSKTLGRWTRKRGPARPSLSDDDFRERSRQSRRRLLTHPASGFVSPRDELWFDNRTAPVASSTPTHEEDPMPSPESQCASAALQPRTSGDASQFAAVDRRIEEYQAGLEAMKRIQKGKGRAEDFERLPSSSGGNSTSTGKGASITTETPLSAVSGSITTEAPLLTVDSCSAQAGPSEQWRHRRVAQPRKHTAEDGICREM